MHNDLLRPPDGKGGAKRLPARCQSWNREDLQHSGDPPRSRMLPDVYYRSSRKILNCGSEWFVVDMGAIQNLARRRILPRGLGFGFPQDFKLQTSNEKERKMETTPGRICLILIALMLMAGCKINPSPSPTPVPPTAESLLTETPMATRTPMGEIQPASATPTSRPLPTQAPTATLAPTGEIQSLQRGYVYLGDPGTVALGFNLSAGGAIGSLPFYGTDFIDDTDFGRYIQFSPYDGGDQYICEPSACSYTTWGWNPLQAGSVDGAPAQVQEYRRWSDGLYIKAPAMEWGHSLGISDVIYETWAWERGGFFEVHIRLTHNGTDMHTLALAEFPAAYFGAALTQPYGYAGADPFTASPIQPYHLLKGDPPISASESWMAFGDQQGNGLILAVPPQPDVIPLWYVFAIEGDTPSPLGYIAPNVFLETHPAAVHELTYYLIPGPIAQGRTIVYDLIPHTTWTFDLNTAEGWIPSGQPVEISDGVLTANLSAADTLTSMPGLNYYGSHAPVVEMTARAGTGGSEYCLNFITLTDWMWSPAKSSCQKIGPGEFRNYRFDFSANPSWMDGLVTQIQLATSRTSVLEIDQIRVEHEFYGWEFNHPRDAGGWIAWNDLLPLQTRDGSMISTATGSDPYMVSPYLGVEAAEFNRIEIRMRSSTASDGASVYFITDQDPNWGEEKSRHFTIISDGEYHNYTIDMSDVGTWLNQILQLRLDPMFSPGDSELDYLRVTRP